MSGPEMSSGDMGKWLQALKLCVSRLDEDCGQLVSATLVGSSLTRILENDFLLTTQRFPWFTQTESLVEVYLDYLANLLSAQVDWHKTIFIKPLSVSFVFFLPLFSLFLTVRMHFFAHSLL